MSRYRYPVDTDQFQEIRERIARLFNSTLDKLFERAIADPETRRDLECILRFNQDFKDRA